MIHASANMRAGALDGRRADTVYLGIGTLGKQSPSFRDTYWRTYVADTGARRVIPIHWDNFTRGLDRPLTPHRSRCARRGACGVSRIGPDHRSVPRGTVARREWLAAVACALCGRQATPPPSSRSGGSDPATLVVERRSGKADRQVSGCTPRCPDSAIATPRRRPPRSRIVRSAHGKGVCFFR